MSERIEMIDMDTGEIIDKRILDNIVKKEFLDKVKRVKCLYENNPSIMTQEEIEFLCHKVYRRKQAVNLNFKRDQNNPDNNNEGFCIKERLRDLDFTTRGFLYSLTCLLSNSNKIVYGNGQPINSITKLCAEIGLSRDMYKRKVKKDIDKYSIIKKNKIGGKTYLILNPLFLIKYTQINEDLFLTFHAELKEHLHPIDYFMLCGRYGVKV